MVICHRERTLGSPQLTLLAPQPSKSQNLHHFFSSSDSVLTRAGFSYPTEYTFVTLPLLLLMDWLNRLSQFASLCCMITARYLAIIIGSYS